MTNLDSYLNIPLACQESLMKYFSSDEALTIFDIGSCEGEDSIRYARLFPNSRIFAFEPVPENFRKILKNLEVYKINSVSCWQEALSDRQGTSVFFQSSGNPENVEKNDGWDYGNKSSSLLKPDKLKDTHKWLKFEKQLNVKTNTIENFCRENNIGVIDYIHMDVQGAELKVLKGAGEFIRKIKAVWLEVESLSLYEGQPLKKDVELFFNRNGFAKKLDTVGDLSGDQLYINRNYFSNFRKMKDFIRYAFVKKK
jgi:FkbM family methyltransferase